MKAPSLIQEHLKHIGFNKQSSMHIRINTAQF